MILRPFIHNQSYYYPFIQNALGNDLLQSLVLSQEELTNLIDSIDETQGNFSYQAGKWTIKQLIQHITDTERIQMYRALRFCRGDQTALVSFDENAYVHFDNTSSLSLNDLKEEFIAVRSSTIHFFTNISKEALDFTGTANDLTFTARMLGWAVSGHGSHHCNIVRERYLK